MVEDAIAVNDHVCGVHPIAQCQLFELSKLKSACCPAADRRSHLTAGVDGRSLAVLYPATMDLEIDRIAFAQAAVPIARAADGSLSFEIASGEYAFTLARPG